MMLRHNIDRQRMRHTGGRAMTAPAKNPLVEPAGYRPAG